jgi:1-acyl-sn-glycerol-3-phosphate acyltransferase
MRVREAVRATTHWVPFVARTVGYGAISLAIGPLTREHRASLWAMRSWCRSSVRGLDIQVDASGLENVPPDGPFVYCSNHQSLVDILVLGSVLPGDYKWAAKRSLMRIPVLGWHLRLSGHVPVDRGAGREAAAAVVERFREVLSRGKPLLIFPEGTRSEDGIVRPFKGGAFAAAVAANVPVVPIALEGTHQLMKKGAFDLGHGVMRHVAVKVGTPLHPVAHGGAEDRIDELRERTRATILDMHRTIGGRVVVAEGSGDVGTVEMRPSASDGGQSASV